MTGYKDKRTLSDWASFKGRIWRENVLENGTEAAIGYFMKGMLFGCEQPFIWEEHCVTSPKSGCEGD